MNGGQFGVYLFGGQVVPKWRFFTTAAFCLHVCIVVSIRALSELKGALHGLWPFPDHPGTMFPVPSLMQV